jgi:hypothetical protein
VQNVGVRKMVNFWKREYYLMKMKGDLIFRGKIGLIERFDFIVFLGFLTLNYILRTT